MKALDLLLKRQSDPQLAAPAPNSTELEAILSAGMRVPDHAALKPYQFKVVQGKGLDKLSDIFVSVANQNNVDAIKLEKTRNMPYRAPLIIIVSTQYVSHEKVPEKEQLITAGCSVHAMQMAAFSLGFGAMWRTGAMSTSKEVKSQLGIDLTEDLVGFLYIGTKAKTNNGKTCRFYGDRVSYL